MKLLWDKEKESEYTQRNKDKSACADFEMKSVVSLVKLDYLKEKSRKSKYQNKTSPKMFNDLKTNSRENQKGSGT